MTLKHSRVFALAALAAAAASSAQAGGLEANGYNWDMLFDPDTYAARATITNVIIDHDIESPFFPGETVGTATNRVHYNVGIKGDLTENVTCLASAQNPWGSGTEREFAYAAGTAQSVSERITSNDLGLTCAYGFDAAGGVFSLIGGVSAQTLDYEATIPFAAPDVTAGVSLDGSGFGWRAGIAYEIPEVALRVSAIYNAPIDYELSGTAYGGTLIESPGTAEVTTPQSFEVKAQTGVAPGWLVLGSVKWVDWSVVDVLTVQNGFAPISTTLNYRDGWTVTGGVGHQLTEDFTVLGSVTWDRGTSQVGDDGVLENGTQTDRWGLTLGGAYSLSEAVELTGGVSYQTIASGSNALPLGETWDRGSVLAVSASLKASF